MGWLTAAAEDPVSPWGCVSNSHSLLISKALVFLSLLLPGEKKTHTIKSHSWPGKKVSDETTQINSCSWIVLRLSGLVCDVLRFKCRLLEQILPKAYRCNSEFGQLLFSFLNTALQLINLQGQNQCSQLSKSGKKNGGRGWNWMIR